MFFGIRGDQVMGLVFALAYGFVQIGLILVAALLLIGAGRAIFRLIGQGLSRLRHWLFR